MTLKILTHLYTPTHQGKYVNLNLIFNEKLQKGQVDNCLLTLEEQGLGEKVIKGHVGAREVPSGEDRSDSNNSICKITFKGIQYFENHLSGLRNSILAISAIVISILTLILSILKIV